MGSSLPKFPSTVVEDGGDIGAERMKLRPARRIGPTGPDQIPTRPKQEPVTTRPRETPTLQSLETAKLAEQETRLAKAGSDRNPRSGISSSDHRVAVVRELYAGGKTDEALALALASEVAPDDPFGGLIPVEDDDRVDPFGGLIPVPDSLPKGGGELELDDPTVAPSAPSHVLRAARAGRAPRLLVSPKELAKLPMDPRAAFIVGHVDGIHSLEEIVDVCAMPESEVLETIDRLCSMGVLSLE